MTEHKIPTKPLVPGTKYDKSRNVFGGQETMAKVFPFVNFFMFIFGIFTVPVEVLLRRDFGQRWFTMVNFFAGLFILLFFAVIQTLIQMFLHSAVYKSIYMLLHPGAILDNWAVNDPFMHDSMWTILIIYVLLSVYHLFRIWWRNRTGTALYSYDDGTSRLEKVGRYTMNVINILAIPFIYLLRFMLPKEERKKKLKTPKLIDDVRVFTNTVIEPAVIFIFVLPGHNWITEIWLVVSGFSLAIYANWKEIAKKNKSLDLIDAKIEAEMMRAHFSPQAISDAAKTVAKEKNKQQHISSPAPNYPELSMMIDQLQYEKFYRHAELVASLSRERTES